MAFTNNVMIVRHGLLAKLIKMWKDGNIVEEIDRLPIKLSPRKLKVKGRCCVHKERAVWKYKSLPLLGYDMTDETDELIPLSYYAQKAMNRTGIEKENIMCVIDEACSSCVQVNYEITNLCRGCVAVVVIFPFLSTALLFISINSNRLSASSLIVSSALL